MIGLVLGCAPPPDDGAWGLREVVDAPSATGEGTGDPERAVNGVRGAGPNAGSLDVYTVGEGLVLGTGGEPVVDGPGDDLVVFENAFRIAGTDDVFVDPGVVEVSPDCEVWTTFPFGRDDLGWFGVAGLEPVLLHAERAPLPPFADAAGGDRFDLADLPDEPVAGEVRADGFVCVRITDVAAWIDPATGEPFEVDAISNGPDIDGIVVRTAR